MRDVNICGSRSKDSRHGIPHKDINHSIGLNLHIGIRTNARMEADYNAPDP
jgi:hypothetical protein